MRRFEKIAIGLMVIPIVLFSYQTIAAEQKVSISMLIPALKGEKLSEIKIKDHDSWQKYYNKSFKKQGSSTSGTIDIGLIELFSKNPDEGSLNYHSAWYSQEEGGTEKFYGDHFNYKSGQFKLRLRNSKLSISTYQANGTWYVSY